MHRTKVASRRPRRKKVKLAYHEAGHAVAAWICGIRVKRVTIVPDARSLGHVVHQFMPVCIETDSWDREDWEAFMYEDREPRGTPSLEEAKHNRETEIIILLAGGIAARRYNPRGREDYTSGDREDMHAFVRSYVTVSAQKGEAYVDRLKARAAEILEEHWYLVKALAEELLGRRTLDGDETTKFLENVGRHRIARQSQLPRGNMEI
jgi:hypothetical protein